MTPKTIVTQLIEWIIRKAKSFSIIPVIMLTTISIIILSTLLCYIAYMIWEPELFKNPLATALPVSIPLLLLPPILTFFFYIIRVLNNIEDSLHEKSVKLEEEIEERKLVEETLKKSEERFRLLFERHVLPMLLVDPDTGSIVDANQAAVNFYGYSREKLITLASQDINQVSPYEDAAEREKAKNQQKNYFVFPHKIAGGSTRIVEVYSSPIDVRGHKLLFSIVQDITERISTETKLKDNENRLYNLFENSPVSLWEEDFSEVRKYIESLDLAGTEDFEAYLERHPDVLAQCATLVKINDVNQASLALHKAPDKQVLFRNLPLTLGEEALGTFRKALNTILWEGGTKMRDYTTLKTLDGEPRHVIISWNVTPGHETTLSKVLVSIIDITERKLIEETLKKSEERFRGIFDNSPDGISVSDIRGRIIAGNEQLAAIYGYKHIEDITGANFLEFLTPKAKERAIQDMPAYLDRDKFNAEYLSLRKDGSTFLAGITGSFIRNNKGEPVQVITIIRDITEKHQAEQKLRDSEALMQAIINNVPVRIFWKDKDLRYMGCNRLFAADAGKQEPSGVLGKNDFMFGWKDQAELYRADDRKVIESGIPKLGYEEPQTTPSGDIIWLRTSKVPLRNKTGEIIGILGVYEDITKRKQSEEALRESLEKLRDLFELSPLGIALTDMDGRYIEFNEAFRAICGYPADELINLDYWELTPKEYEAKEAEQLASLAKTGRYGPYEKEYQQKGGTLIPIRLNGTLITGKDGKKYIWSIVEDITGPKRAQQRLQQAIEFNEGVINSIPDLLFELDSNGKYLNIWARNPELLAAQKEALLGNTVSDMLPREAAEIVMEAIREAEDNGVSLGKLIRIDLPQGEAWFELSTSRKSNNSFLMLSRDVTERKHYEEELKSINATKDKFFSIIAHDLKNPFNALLGFSEMLHENLGDMDEKKVKDTVEIIYHNAENAYSLIENLLTWSRAQLGRIEFKPQMINLGEVVAESMNITEGQAAHKDIGLVNHAGDTTVYADPNLMKIILRNLLSNAIKYTNEGGSVTVSSRQTGQAGGETEISVSDTGVGMPPEAIEKVFRIETKYSTPGTAKEQGTGLGLILCKEFVEKHCGRIWAESEVGKGTTFRFTLPGGD